MENKKVVIAGGGVLGSQIAYQTYLVGGYDTTIRLRSEGSIGRAQPKLDRLNKIYTKLTGELAENVGNEKYPYPHGLLNKDFKDFTEEDAKVLVDRAKNVDTGLKISLDLNTLKDADIVIEAISENPEVKIDFFNKIHDLLKEDCLLLTNTSSLLPSMFAKYTPNPGKFLSMHFANNIWKLNTAEIMGHSKTSQEAVNEAVEFAKSIGMVPLVLKKEQPAYLLNSLLIPLLNSATLLYANEIADAETIDKAWELGTGAPAGPLKILDVVGIKTAYDIAEMMPGHDDPTTNAGKIYGVYKKLLDEGKGGLNFGEGFYKYK